MSRPEVDVPIADIDELHPGLERTELLARITNTLADYLQQFLEIGFAPMKPAWEAMHGFADREVQITKGGTRQAEGNQVGKVLGVSDSGRLIVRVGGVPVELDAGEVSLRPVGAHS